MAGVEVVSEQGFRTDGRKPNELRRIRCKQGVFSHADGSAYIEQGNTKVLATVYGPHEIRGSRSKALHDRAYVNCQFSMATFSTGERKQRPRGDRKSTEMTMHMKQTFEATILTQLYPRSQIDIFVEVLQADGGNFAACVNAATLALIDAGIPLKDYVCACTVGFVDDVTIVDINHLEETNHIAEFTVAMLPKSEQFVMLEMSSRLHLDHLSKVMDMATKACKDVHLVLDRAVRDHVSEVWQQLGNT
ncbi:PREDICTED: exosome complex component RRP41-like [Priapulus caudatus]|uniref:Exosome complex component RRP41-like n=1 Tax=Priapulus caudatus TaxID=37621 RepID=A0ABM1E0H8_PRICU|nr:PREDICTED: exosome complex component RRP41-like [Priapulus caudatus]